MKAAAGREKSETRERDARNWTAASEAECFFLLFYCWWCKRQDSGRQSISQSLSASKFFTPSTLFPTPTFFFRCMYVILISTATRLHLFAPTYWSFSFSLSSRERRSLSINTYTQLLFWQSVGQRWFTCYERITKWNAMYILHQKTAGFSRKENSVSHFSRNSLFTVQLNRFFCVCFFSSAYRVEERSD